MRNRTLLVVLVMLICFALAASAATVKTTTKPAAKPAAKSAAKVAKPAAAKPGAFDLDAALTKFWSLPDNAPVGTVNGSPISKGELVKSMWFSSASRSLGDMLNSKMAVDAAKKAGVVVTDADIKAKEMEICKQRGCSSVPELLQKFGVSKEFLLSFVTPSVYAEKAVRKTLKVSDAELAQWVKARHILVQFPPNETDQTKKEAAAKAKIDDVAKKLKDGGKFDQLADQYSEDPGNTGRDGKKQGGELGWFTRGRMVPEFEKAAFDLKAGQTSDPVKTNYGYHIIQVEAIGKDVTGKEKSDLKAKIIDDQLMTKMQEWFQKLQATAVIKNYIAAPPVKEPTSVVRPQPPARPIVRPTPPPPAPSGTTPAPAPAPESTPPPPPPSN